MPTILRVCRVLIFLNICSCWAQVQFPTYSYILPAIADKGGPAYVIPGTVTEESTISLTNVTGSVCLRTGYCTNAAGIVTAAAGNTNAPGSDSFFIALQPDGSEQEFEYGAVLISIEGVGYRQVFPANKANGLNSISPPTRLNASQPTFKSLGFQKFSKQNARIRFIVADTDYADNSGDFLLTLQTPSLTYNTDTTKKITQVVGPCDWVAWNFGADPCTQTAASGHPSQVLGMDLGFSFEDTTAGNLIFLFGDTIGVQIASGSALVPAVQTPSQFVEFGAHDAIATAAVTSTPSKFHLDFLERPGTSPAPGIPNAPVFVEPTPQPDGAPVLMGAFDVPNSGIHVKGENYIIVNTRPKGSNDATFARSVLVDYVSNTDFEGGRTISTANVASSSGIVTEAGHFVFVAPHELQLDFAQQLGLPEAGVLIFGNGQYRHESIYLSYIPASQFWSGENGKGNPSTKYFTGLDATGHPMWTTTELCAVPVVYDNPTNLPTNPSCSAPVDPGTAGNVSVTYNKTLSLWLMTWDGGKQPGAVGGIFFSYASAPWGPWSTPQNIYNACEAHSYGEGYGDFIRFTGDPTDCAALLVPPATLSSPSGPKGPIIGTSDDPFYGTAVTNGNTETATTRRGGIYAPFQIASFAAVEGDGLSIYFNMSTWNPYTVVLMESNFIIAPAP